MSDAECDLLCIDFDHAEHLRATLPEMDAISRIANRVKVFGDPTRLRIGYALQQGEELCVCDLAWIIGSSQGLVSHHLRQLRAGELVDSRRDGKLVMYRLTDVGRSMLTVVTSTALDPAAPDRAFAVTPGRPVAAGVRAAQTGDVGDSA